MTTENKSKKKVATKVIVGVFLTLAAAGFVFSDMQQFVGSNNDQVVRTVGDHDILLSDIRQERNAIAQRLGSIPQSPLIQQRLVTQALENITLRNAIITYAKSLGIAASNAEIAKIITSIDAFKDLNGTFDKLAFKKILRNQRVSIKEFKGNIANNVIQGNFTNPIEADFPISDIAVTVFNQFATTIIDFDAYTLNLETLPDTVNTITKPTDEQLQALYKEQSETLKRPLLKNIDYVVFDKDHLKDKIIISDNVVQEFYDTNKKTLFFMPETRKIIQVVFDSKEEADDALKQLNEGVSFQSAAEELGFDIEDIDLGYLVANDLEENVRSTVFDMDLGETSKPLKTDFGFTIYFVEAIKPEEARSFEQVKLEIKDTLLNKKLNNYLSDIMVKIDDDLAGGADFTEITQKYGSWITAQENITNQGEIFASDDNVMPIMTQLNPLIPIDYINDYSVGDDIPIIELNNNAFALLKVKKSTPQRPLTFEEAETFLSANNMTTQATALLTKIADEIKESDFNAEIMQKYQVKPKAYSIKRSDNIPEALYRANFQELVFATEPNQNFTSIDEKEAILLNIKAISMPKAILRSENENADDDDSKNDAEDFTEKLQTSYNAQIQNRAIEMVRDAVTIENNNKAFETLLTREANL
ncbi:MAG: peptidyl-prolyl cis-trans isomerase D [Alphaproteobacteria bacterium]|jgi:peptidyl-prolyl cis-trans isomerase D